MDFDGFINAIQDGTIKKISICGKIIPIEKLEVIKYGDYMIDIEDILEIENNYQEDNKNNYIDYQNFFKF